jgi:hypothetical protein
VERVIAASAARGRARVFEVSSPFGTTGNENLRIVSVNLVTGVRIIVQGRRLALNGETQPFAFDQVPATNGTVTTSNFPLGIGTVLNMSIFVTGASPLIGQTFVQAKLILGFSGATIVLGTILQGYINASQELSWPGSPLVASTDVVWPVRAITGTAPAAGVEIVETCPTGRRWELLQIATTLTLDGVPTAVRAGIKLFNGGVATYQQRTGTNLNVANNAAITWTPGATEGVAAQGDNFWMVLPLPIYPLILAGGSFQTWTNNLDVHSIYTAPNYLVRELLEVP